jgi:hypothetical protein
MFTYKKRQQESLERMTPEQRAKVEAIRAAIDTPEHRAENAAIHDYFRKDRPGLAELIRRGAVDIASVHRSGTSVFAGLTLDFVEDQVVPRPTYPPGWDEARVRRFLDRHEGRTETDLADAIEAALAAEIDQKDKQ